MTLCLVNLSGAILQEVGRGGMAVVYKGEDPTLERLVAIKLLPPKFLRNPDARTRFRREAKVAARLDHPNIVKIYDVGEDEGSFHIVMEYLEGETLREYIEGRSKINQEESLSFVRQMCLALDYAHNQKVVHRDIKPENIMVINKRIIKIMDFGLAFVDNQHSVTQAGAIMGTIAYFSPEQARGEPCDSRSDIYSLGIILFELLTGKLPFEATNPSDMIQKHLYAEPPSPSHYNSTLPPIMEQVIKKLLAKDPSDRYQSAQELLLELNKLSKQPLADIFNTPYLFTTEETLSDPPEHIAAQEQEKNQIDATEEPLLLEELNKLLTAESQGEDLATLLKNEQFSRDNLPPEAWGKFRNVLERLQKDKSMQGKFASKSPEDFAITGSLLTFCPQCGNELKKETQECISCKNIAAPADNFKEISYKQARSHLDAAFSFYENGDYRDALKQVISALAINPKIPEAHYIHGCILKEENDFKESLEAFKRCLDLEPEHVNAYEKIGEIYFGEKRYEEALKYFRQSLLLEPARPDLYCKIAKVHEAGGHLHESRHYLEQALKLEPTHTRALKQYSAILILEEEWGKGVSTLEMLLEIDPHDLEAHKMLGEIYEKTNRISLAMIHYETALLQVFTPPPDNSKTDLEILPAAAIEAGKLHTRMGQLLERQNQWEQAKQEYLLAIQNNPKDSEAHFNLAELYKIEDKIDLAIKELELVVKLEPNQALSHHILGSLYLKQEKQDPAKLHLELAVALDPLNADTHHKLGQIYYQSDQSEQAVNACKSAISLDPYNPEYHETLSMVHYMNQQLDDAAEALEKALTLDSNNSDYHKALGVIHEGRKRFDLAIKEYERAIEINPDDALAHGLLGKAYFASGLLNMAIYQYQKSAALHPHSHLIHSLLGRAYTKQGKIDLAIDEFKKAIEFAPRGDARKSQQVLGKAYKNLGSAYLEQGELQSALDMFKTATNLIPGDLELLRLMGNAYIDNNDFDTAKTLLEEAIRKDPAHAKTYLDLATCFDFKNDSILAKQTVEKAITLDSLNNEFYEFLGDLEERDNNIQAAIQAFQHCLELNGGQKDLYQWRLGRLYMESGAIEAAQIAYTKAININPKNWHYYSDLAQTEEILGNLKEAIDLMEQACLLNPPKEFLPLIDETIERLKHTSSFPKKQ